jgi:hypothetical protein
VIVGNQQLVGDDILVDLGDDGLHVVIGLAPFGIVVGQDQPGKTHARDFEIHRGSAQQIDAGQKIDAAVAQILGRRPRAHNGGQRAQNDDRGERKRPGRDDGSDPETTQHERPRQ